MPIRRLTPDVASQVAFHSCLHPLQKDLIAAKIALSENQARTQEIEVESNRKRDGVSQVNTAFIALESRFKSELNNLPSKKRVQKDYDQEKKALMEAKLVFLYLHQFFLYNKRHELARGKREEATLETQVVALQKQLDKKIQKNIFHPKENRLEGACEHLQSSKFRPFLEKYLKILFQLKSQSSNRHRVQTQTSSESRDSEEELSKKRSSTINDSEQSFQSAKNWAALLVEARLSLLLPQDWNHRELLFSQLSNKQRCKQSLLFIGPEESDLDQGDKLSEK
jgi:hypothetical protein